MNSEFEKRNVVIYGRVSTEHEAFVEKIVVSKDGFDWYLRCKPETHKCNIKGRTRQYAHILEPEPSAECPFEDSDTGSYC